MVLQYVKSLNVVLMMSGFEVTRNLSLRHPMKTSEDENDNHSIQDFTQYINSLPEGHYIFKNGQFVKVK